MKLPDTAYMDSEFFSRVLSEKKGDEKERQC